MDSNRTLVVILEGNLGSGKREFLYRLKMNHPNYLIVSSPITLFNKFQTYKPITYHSKNASFACQLHIIMSLRTWYKKVFQNLHKYPVVVIENCRDNALLYTEALMETGHLTSYEKEFYKDLFVLNYVNEINFPVADACFVLSSNPNTCLENIKLRARPGEDHVDLEFLKCLDRNLSRYRNERPVNLRYSMIENTADVGLIEEVNEFLMDIRQ